MAVVYYEGEVVYFRPLELEDEPQVRRWINDPRVWTTLCFRPPYNAVREREWIEGQGRERGLFTFGIAVKQTDELIGTCDLRSALNPARSASLGIMIGAVERQNQGYGTAAMRLLLRFGFEEMNLNRIELTVYDTNPRAVRVYEKVGFVLEGRHRQAEFRQGRYVDVLRYAVLREDWLKTAPPAAQAV